MEVKRNCVGEPGCQQSSREQGKVDPKTRQVVPVIPYPFICHKCWLKGWRVTGKEVYCLSAEQQQQSNPLL